MVRGLLLLALIVCLALSAARSHAAEAALICETAPGVRHLERAMGFRTDAEANSAVRARCRKSTLLFQARAEAPDRRPLLNPSPTAESPRERACRRYPNLC